MHHAERGIEQKQEVEETSILEITKLKNSLSQVRAIAHLYLWYSHRISLDNIKMLDPAPTHV
jgi:hypothetical protein